MAGPQLSIEKALVQHYLLEVETDAFATVREAVVRAGEEQSSEQSKVGAWRMFAWLDRPAIWAIRPVEVTSGLDTFLLEDKGLEGLRDVSEIITCAIRDASSERDGITESWSEFAETLSGPGVLFATFLWPNWDALSRPEAWGSAPVPPRSQVLAAIRRTLGVGMARVTAQGLWHGKVSLLLCASVGDCDLVLYGRVQTSHDLDLCLYLLTQMGSDALAVQSFAPKHGSSAQPWPVFRSSRTELALDLSTYEDALGSAGAQSSLAQDERRVLEASFGGELFPEVGLMRGHGPIPQMEGRLAEIAGNGWQDRAVFGREDFILETDGARDFAETVELMARLDSAAAKNPAFPRRSSIRLGIGSLVHGAKPPTRAALFGENLAETTDTPPPFTPHDGAGVPDIGPMRKLIAQLRAAGWREDLRIIERMAERCVTLQKSPDLRRETRCIIGAALERLTNMCQRLEASEALLRDDSPVNGEPALSPAVKAKIASEIRRLRSELLQSGMNLDRVLSHHSKGAVSLLLHRASQARGPEHIGSEIGLSMGLGVLFRAPAHRLQEQLRTTVGASADTAEWLRELDGKLAEVATPIIYASHEPDFYIRPELTLLRVPRWALWYPAAASHLIHELGHSLAVIGSLGFLMSKTLRRLFSGDAAHDNGISRCPHLETALTALGLPETRDELRMQPAPLGEFAGEFFTKIGAAGGENFGADAEKLALLEEIMADVVARLFSYGDAEPGDQRQLWDCFDYIAPFTARDKPESNHDRLLRLLAAHIAVRQVRAVRQTCPQPLAAKGREALWEITQEATRSFHRHLGNWAADFAGREEHRGLPPVAYEAIATLPATFRAALNDDKGKKYLHTYQLAAHFITIILSIPPLSRSCHQSLFKSTHLWGNLLAAAWDGGAALEPEISAALRQGSVPNTGCLFPERLPRAVAWEFRERIRREVPAHVRVALSFYLYDLSRI